MHPCNEESAPMSNSPDTNEQRLARQTSAPLSQPVDYSLMDWCGLRCPYRAHDVERRFMETRRLCSDDGEERRWSHVSRGATREAASRDV